MKSEKKKKNPFLIVLRVIVILVIVAVVLFGGLIAYLSVKEYRPADVESIEVSNDSTQSPSEGDTIKLITWNVGYGALGESADFFMDGGKSVNTASKKAVKENIDAVSDFAKKQDADIMLFQEVDVLSDRSHKVDEAERLKYVFNDFSSAFAYNFNVNYLPYPIPPIGKVESGLFTLSRYKIDSAERIQLPNPFSWPVRTINLKRCLEINRIPLEGSDRELVIINLHLEAYDSGEGKTAQTAMLRDYLTAEADKGNYVIAGGDFNQIFSSEDQNKYPVGEDKWTPGVLDVTAFGSGWQFLMDESVPTCRSLDQPYRHADKDTFQYYLIDGFIVSENVTVNSFKTADLGFVNSDHNPVVLEITLNK